MRAVDITTASLREYARKRSFAMLVPSIMPEVESAIRDKIREKITSGLLPLLAPNRTWGGPGAGLRCVVCEQPISKDQIEFEVQFIQEGQSAPQVSHFHLDCFAAWELERSLLLRKSATA